VKKILTRLFLGLVLVVGLGVVGAGAWLFVENRPADPVPGAAGDQRFRIPPGEALSVSAQRLADRGLIRNALLFRLFFQFGASPAGGGEGTFPSGTFAVPRGLTARDAAQWFRTAKPLLVKVTVPEGWTASKIARLLEEKEVVPARDFLEVVQHPGSLGDLAQGLSSLEGRLYPDTYLFPLGLSAADVARTFVKTFRDKTAAWAGRLGPEEFASRVVLASIVEREYRDPAEAALIASVFENRLEHGIPLGSCATIEYILTEVQGRPHPKRIFFVHTQIESPYNTYLHKGLPPAPIANPGLTALRAAFEPAVTNYLYFVVADPAQGTHTFSSQYSQHEKAREAYLNTYVTKG